MIDDLAEMNFEQKEFSAFSNNVIVNENPSSIWK